MQGVKFYRIAIVLPALAALLAIVLIALFWSGGVALGVLALVFAALGDAEAEDTAGLLLLLALLSPVLAGSLVASAVLLRRLRDQPEQAYRRLSRRAPIWVGAATFVASSAFLVVVTDFDPDVILVALIVGVVSVVLGYLYVGLAAVLLRTLRAISVVEPIDGPPASMQG